MTDILCHTDSGYGALPGLCFDQHTLMTNLKGAINSQHLKKKQTALIMHKVLAKHLTHTHR